MIFQLKLRGQWQIVQIWVFHDLFTCAMNHTGYSHCHGITKSHLVFHLFRVFSLPSQKWNTSCVCQGEGVIYTVFSDLVLKITKLLQTPKSQSYLLPPLFLATFWSHHLFLITNRHHLWPSFHCYQGWPQHRIPQVTLRSNGGATDEKISITSCWKRKL